MASMFHFFIRHAQPQPRFIGKFCFFDFSLGKLFFPNGLQKRGLLSQHLWLAVCRNSHRNFSQLIIISPLPHLLIAISDFFVSSILHCFSLIGLFLPLLADRRNFILDRRANRKTLKLPACPSIPKKYITKSSLDCWCLELFLFFCHSRILGFYFPEKAQTINSAKQRQCDLCLIFAASWISY